MHWVTQPIKLCKSVCTLKPVDVFNAFGGAKTKLYSEEQLVAFYCVQEGIISGVSFV